MKRKYCAFCRGACLVDVNERQFRSNLSNPASLCMRNEGWEYCARAIVPGAQAIHDKNTGEYRGCIVALN